MFNSNVQPKRRMGEKPGLWFCNCRKPLGPYQLNSGHLVRCPVCGVERHSDPTVGANAKLAPGVPAAAADDDGPCVHSWENKGGS